MVGINFFFFSLLTKLPILVAKSLQRALTIFFFKFVEPNFTLLDSFSFVTKTASIFYENRNYCVVEIMCRSIARSGCNKTSIQLSGTSTRYFICVQLSSTKVFMDYMNIIQQLNN